MILFVILSLSCNDALLTKISKMARDVDYGEMVVQKAIGGGRWLS